MRYGRGIGIHSPRAYQEVLSLVRPYSGYYYFATNPEIFPTELYYLVYRLVARYRPSKVFLLSDSIDLERIIHQACSTSIIEKELSINNNSSLIITNRVSDLEQLKMVGDGTYIIITEIRRTKVVEKLFKEWANRMNQGIIVDLYDYALVIGIKHVKYIYRSTL